MNEEKEVKETNEEESVKKTVEYKNKEQESVVNTVEKIDKKQKKNFGLLKLIIAFTLLGGVAYAGGTWLDNKLKTDDAAAQAKAEEGTQTSVFRLDGVKESDNDDLWVEYYSTLTFKHKEDEIRKIVYEGYTKYRDKKFFEKKLKNLKLKEKDGKYYDYLGPYTYHVYDLENLTWIYHNEANYKDMKEGSQRIVGDFPKDIQTIGPDEESSILIKADKTPFSVYQKLLLENKIPQIQ